METEGKEPDWHFVDLLELEGLNDPRDFSSYGSVVSRECSPLLARDAFVITNRRDIAVIFVRLSVCLGLACIVIIQCMLAPI